MKHDGGLSRDNEIIVRFDSRADCWTAWVPGDATKQFWFASADNPWEAVALLRTVVVMNP